MLRFPYFAFLSLAGCATVESAHGEGNQIPYKCNDLVIVGRQTQLNEEAVPSDYPLGVSRRQFSIQIKQVVRGSERRTTVLAEGTSHAQPRNDPDFLMVLEPRPDGTYWKRTAALWNASRGRSSWSLVPECPQWVESGH